MFSNTPQKRDKQFSRGFTHFQPFFEI